MVEIDYYLNKGLFVPSDKGKLLGADFPLYRSLGRHHQDFQATGMQFVTTPDLEAELIAVTKEKPAHLNELAFEPKLFIPDSADIPLAQQDEAARQYIKQLRKKLRFVYVDGGISRLTDYEEVIQQHSTTTRVKLLEVGKYQYLRARTRTRVFPDRVGQNYVTDIGPYSKNGLTVSFWGRDEGDCQVGVWVLLYPSSNPQ